MNYLVGTSALVRILRRQVDESWHDQVTHGLVAICDPVLTEALTIARTNEYQLCRPSWRRRASTKDFQWRITWS